RRSRCAEWWPMSLDSFVPPPRACLGSGRDFVFALDETARVVPRGDVPQGHVARQRAEERYPAADEHGHARDREPLDESGLQEPLDGNPSVHIDVTDVARLDLLQDLRRLARHVLD